LAFVAVAEQVFVPAFLILRFAAEPKVIGVVVGHAGFDEPTAAR
jgi:hypothetical protein